MTSSSHLLLEAMRLDRDAFACGGLASGGEASVTASAMALPLEVTHAKNLRLASVILAGAKRLIDVTGWLDATHRCEVLHDNAVRAYPRRRRFCAKARACAGQGMSG